MSATFAFLHHLAAFALVSALAVEFALTRGELTVRNARTILLADALFGAFAGIILDAALDARADVSVVEKRMQSRDHPVVLGMPETYYLKCFVLRKLA